MRGIRTNSFVDGCVSGSVAIEAALLAFEGLEPDAVFVGGSKGSMLASIETALERLDPGGRLVANAMSSK